jgi:hypothetical protein
MRTRRSTPSDRSRLFVPSGQQAKTALGGRQGLLYPRSAGTGAARPRRTPGRDGIPAPRPGPRSLRVSPGPSRHRPPLPIRRPQADPAIPPRGRRHARAADRRLAAGIRRHTAPHRQFLEPVVILSLTTATDRPAGAGPPRGRTVPLPPVPSRHDRIRAEIIRVRLMTDEAGPRPGGDHPASGSCDGSIPRRADGAAHVVPAANSRLRRGVPSCFWQPLERPLGRCSL